MKVLIVAGGTGGHLYPGISVAQALREQNIDVLMIIRPRTQEKEIVKSYNLSYKTIEGIGLKKNVLAILKLVYYVLKGFLEAGRIISDFQPDVIFALGNYLSLPVVVAGYFKRIPIVIHEQNCLPGKATRVLSNFAKIICVSFSDSFKYLAKFQNKVIHTGNPLRKELLQTEKQVQDDVGRKNILVFGGSLGAHSINLAIIEALDWLEGVRRDIRLTHLTGPADLEMVESGYREKNFEVTVAAYLEQMQQVYQQADLVIARAGATTLSELAYFGLPAILIPYPFAAENHQLINAQVFEKAGAAKIILNSELNGQKLAEVIIGLLSDEKQLSIMGKNTKELFVPGAMEKIVKIIKSEECPVNV